MCFNKSLILFVLILVLVSNIFAQASGITAKYITNLGNSYYSYSDYSIQGFFSLYDNNFEFGPTLGISASKPKVNFKFDIPDYYHVDVIDITKSYVGASLFYTYNVFDSTYVPFIGLMVEKYLDSKSFFFLNGEFNNIMKPGLYDFYSKDEYELSLSIGMKIVTKGFFNILFEVEYQHRVFTLEYDEYQDNPEGLLDLTEHSDKQIIDAFNFGIGLQFIF
ncbi:MAG: hypothetical protein KKF62_16370 [Bacteroidetes bacterium]|nr:hypothetical protein [Bacteroidota bacterium]MBU1113679.1 hypothetical protein [Bacteroidota bacterium]MBU1799102.1 hypothetical protein [Bacteroidota bacterium]